MNARDLTRFIGPLLLGAAIAFPAGLWLAQDSRTEAPPPAVPADVTGRRAAFSPVVTADPHFVAEQRKGAEALERSCRETGEFCAEAQAARRWLAEHGGVQAGN